MKKNQIILLACLLIIAVGLVGCGGEAVPTEEPTPIAEPTAVPTDIPPPTPDTPIISTAPIDSIQIVTLESFPVQVNVLARGQLADGCTTLNDSRAVQSGNGFQVTITTIRTPAEVCTQQITPFEETVPLEVENLTAGTYGVTVNGIAGSFTLEQDNVAQEEPAEPEATEVAVTGNGIGSIVGRVWHDLCAATVGADEPPSGCVADVNGGFLANGQLENDEPGIEGVLISLGNGECPAADLDTTTTDDNGSFTFADLEVGTYCVSVDPLVEQNENVLAPGSFTAPELDVNSITVALSAEETQAGINFGWDYQFLPLAEVDPNTCTNIIQFIEDLNIPDDTVFAPGAEISKSWRLRNNGTCPWTDEYSLAFVSGDEISGTASIPLPQAVAPGQTVDVTAELIAPDEPGVYRSNFQIADSNGNPFGIGGIISEAFWVQFVVEEGAEAAATPLPSGTTGTIGGVVWRDRCFFNSSGVASSGCLETADGSGVFRGDGSFNTATEPIIASITVSLSAGACPDVGVPSIADTIQTAVTGDDGLYRFTDLDDGLYCIFIDPFRDENVIPFIPGDWTWPALGTGRQGINLGAGEQRLEVDFGWDDADD